MPELTYSSAGVGTREIDLSQPSSLGPQGTPACVIGTSQRGPAFVPVTVGDFKSFVSQFGESDGEMFAPLAVNEWLKNAQSLTFVRTLGIGTGTGDDTDAGFVIGEKLPSTETGFEITNPYGTSESAGSMYLISGLMTDSADSNVFLDAGISETSYETTAVTYASSTTEGLTLTQADGDTIEFTVGTTVNTYTRTVGSWNVITGYSLTVTDDTGSGNGSVIITDTEGDTAELNGVVPTYTGSGSPTLDAFVDGVDQVTGTYAKVARAMVMIPYGVTMSLGSYDDATKTVTMSLTGTTDVDDITFTLSLDPTSAYYVAKVLNTDPLQIEEKGHCLYNHFEIDEKQAAVAPVGTSVVEMIVAEDIGDIDANYKTFKQRFDHATSPWVKSQSFGSDKHNLFKIHALSDGELENTNIKLSIINLRYDKNDSWGTFDLVVRDFNDTDAGQKHIERFSSLNLDPTSSNFIAKKIGDKRTWFNLDKSTQQLQTSGTYDNVSKYIRVEVSDEVAQSQIPVNAIPFGHEAYEEMVIADEFDAEVNLPLPFRQNITTGIDLTLKTFTKLHWGLQLSKVQDLDEPNESFVQSSIVKNLVKFLPDTIVARTGHEFTLENIEVDVKDEDADTSERAIDWTVSHYRFDSDDDTSDSTTRFLKASDVSGSTNSSHVKFTMFMQGGFDGNNIFREQKAKMMNSAVVWEMIDAANQGGTSGPTVTAYRKALDVITSKSDVEIQMLAVPGIRHSAVTQYAMDAVESRFDALFIADILEKDSSDDIIINSDQITDVGNTIAQFESEGFDTSFAAAYFPDVVMTDPITKTTMKVPPSVAVLGAMSLNDSIAHPWYAPAGFTRGALRSVEDTAVSFSRTNLDSLYEAKINPLTSFSGTETVIWGQKTLLQAASALDRVNVRRLLIEIRRSVKNIALGFLFEPNRAETLAKFEAKVNPLLQSIQEKSGLDRYKVKIDTETTTQVDVENNTLRGKIYIQPTKTAEFISLDFVVSNTL